MPRNKNQKAVLTRPCYTLVTEGKTAELTMYGEVVAQRPYDYWNDREDDGNYIVLQEFIEDLDSLAQMEQINIHLQSLGGDAESSVDIYNRLKGLSAKVTVTVDGIAASGGSLIMCAGDTVRVNPSSMVMIHKAWSFFFGFVNADDIAKYKASMDAVDKQQAEIYHAKTGKDVAELLTMMGDETYLTGREAVEQGFADELIEDDATEPPTMSVSADRRYFTCNGHRMRMAALGKLPDTIKVETAPTSGVDKSKQPEDMGKKEKGRVMMTWEEFQRDNPEAAEAAMAEARASVDTGAAVAAERQRLADIDAIAGLFGDDVVKAAKYGENACTAQEMAYRAALASVQQGRQFLADLQEDAEGSGVKDVTPAPAPVEETTTQTSDDLIAAGMAAAKKIQEVK